MDIADITQITNKMALGPDYIMSIMQKTAKLNEILEERKLNIDKILLEDNFKFDCDIYYNKQRKAVNYCEYVSLPVPTLEEIKLEYGCIERKVISEFLNSKIKEKRLEQEKQCREILKQRLVEYVQKEKQRRNKYENLMKQKRDEVDAYNSNIQKNKNKLLTCDKEEVEKVLSDYISQNLKNTLCDNVFDIEYQVETHTCIIDYKYSIDKNIPNIERYEANIISGEPNASEITEKSKNILIEKYVFNSTLKVLKIVCDFGHKWISNVAFNGYAYFLNIATGNVEEFNILSILVENDEFSKINLAKVEPKICLENLSFRYVSDLKKVKNVIPYKKINNMAENKMLLENIDFNIDGYEFEKLAKDLLKCDGFSDVEVTSLSGDYGADVIAYKDDIKYAIQCKKYSQLVGVKAVQEVIASKNIYNCHVAVVLTNNYFTPQARKLATLNNVLLWDRNKLEELIKKSYSNK